MGDYARSHVHDNWFNTGPLFGPPPKERVRQPVAVGWGNTHESHPIKLELKGKLPELEAYKHQQT